MHSASLPSLEDERLHLSLLVPLFSSIPSLFLSRVPGPSPLLSSPGNILQPSTKRNNPIRPHSLSLEMLTFPKPTEQQGFHAHAHTECLIDYAWVRDVPPPFIHLSVCLRPAILMHTWWIWVVYYLLPPCSHFHVAFGLNKIEVINHARKAKHLSLPSRKRKKVCSMTLK